MIALELTKWTVSAAILLEFLGIIHVVHFLESAGGSLCHHQATRCFGGLDGTWVVCARCSGMYFGWIMKLIIENAKGTDHFENTLRIKGQKFTYTMKYRTVLRPGAPAWTTAEARHLRSFTSTTVYSGTIVRVGNNDFDAKIESFSRPDKSPLHSPADDKSAQSKVGKTWKYTYQNGVLMDARNSSTVFRRP